MGVVTVLALATDLTFAIAAGFAKGLRFVTGLAFATDLRLTFALGLAVFLDFATGLRFTTGLDLVIGLRLAGGVAFLATANRRRGFRLAPGAADWVLLADDARFMG